MDNMISVMDIEPESLANGLGVRVVVFCAGCNFHCKNCHNPQTWDMNNGYLVSIQEIFDKIMIFPITTGVTYSGGEPMLQAKALYELTKIIKAKTKYDIWCFSGYLFENIVSSQDEKFELLKEIDVLVDGRYIDELKFKQPTLYRGSLDPNIQEYWDKISPFGKTPTPEELIELLAEKLKNKKK